jgi:hypothetical protein
LLVEVEHAIEQEIVAAIEAAKQAGFPSYEWSLAQVSADSYAPLVTDFVSGRATAFDSRQAETRLKPY